MEHGRDLPDGLPDGLRLSGSGVHLPVPVPVPVPVAFPVSPFPPENHKTITKTLGKPTLLQKISLEKRTFVTHTQLLQHSPVCLLFWPSLLHLHSALSCLFIVGHRCFIPFPPVRHCSCLVWSFYRCFIPIPLPLLCLLVVF